MNEAKPFMIQRRQVMDAYLKVKANKGGGRRRYGKHV
jgi:hypothetical protein